MASSERRPECPRHERLAPALASTLVVHTDRPDRRTLYPPDTDNVARMSTWLTADDDAFVDLASMR